MKVVKYKATNRLSFKILEQKRILHKVGYRDQAKDLPIGANSSWLLKRSDWSLSDLTGFQKMLISAKVKSPFYSFCNRLDTIFRTRAFLSVRVDTNGGIYIIHERNIAG